MMHLDQELMRSEVDKMLFHASLRIAHQQRQIEELGVIHQPATEAKRRLKALNRGLARFAITATNLARRTTKGSIMPKTVGPAGDSDETEAYLFLCLGNGHYAISKDREGSNLPLRTCAEGWKFVRSFALGVREALPVEGNPEPILRALLDKGYYIAPSGGHPSGTSQ